MLALLEPARVLTELYLGGCGAETGGVSLLARSLLLVAFASPALAAASLTEAFASAAPAAARFGEQGQIVPLGALQAVYSSNGELKQTLLGFSPGALYFFARDFALGAELNLNYTNYSVPGSSTEVSATSFGIAPTCAFNLVLGERFSFFPQAAVRFGSSTPFAIVGGATTVQTRVTAQLFAPVLFHVVPHFFLGVGPAFSIDLFAGSTDSGRSPKTASLGAQTLLGGYF